MLSQSALDQDDDDPFPEQDRRTASKVGSPPAVEARAKQVAYRKRLFDVAVALILVAFTGPLFVAIAFTVRVGSRGPILFWQRRTGLNGTIFRIVKFRTMHVAEDHHDLCHATEADPRITRVGAFLRRSSLDELPQLINILAGQMSFVGPRPHAIGHDAYYADRIPNYVRRFAVQPGLTGLAQVRGLRGEIRSLQCMTRRIDADCEYIDRWSLLLDVRILLGTLPRLIKDPSAY